MKLINSLWLIASFCFCSSAMATDYYVNPTGSDAWSGMLKTANANKSDGPFKTLEKAKQTIRTLKQTNTFNDKVTVNIATGLYYLSKTLSFNLADSGLPGKEILWQGEPGAQVTISAGLPITCKKRKATTLWDCPLKTLPVNTAYFDTGRIKGNGPKFDLYVNDQKLELARWPDQGWAHIKMPIDQNTQFTVMEQLPTLPGNITAAQVHIFAGNDWYDQFIGVASINQSANALKLASTTSYALASGRRFYLQNLPSLLNAPGEWIYDSAIKKVSVIPPAGITPKAAILSSLPNILIVDGVNNLTFKNISFQHSAGTAITVKNSSNVVLDHLDVNSIGGKGVDIGGGQNVQLSNSKIHHTGAHGVVVSGGDKVTLKASGHVIHNNHIHHMSSMIMTYTPGIEINGVGVKVTHNLLEQGPHDAIIFAGNNHLIEKNEIHHFCLQTSDAGAIYSGRNWSWRGNTIVNNYIHDIIGYGMKSVDVAKNQVDYQSIGWVRGVYLDDGMSGVEVRGNIFENAGTEEIFINGGRDNKITNNYFKTNSYAIAIDHRDYSQNQKTLDDSPYKSSLWQQAYPGLAAPINNKIWPEGNQVQRNVIVSTNPVNPTMMYRLPNESTIIADNIVWSPSGNALVHYKILDSNNPVFLGDKPWAQWLAAGIEHGSMVIDPCVTIVNKKMITCPSSPIKDFGFTPLPTDIGLIP